MEHTVSARIVVPTAMRNEFVIAPTTSWVEKSTAMFSKRAVPGSIRDDSTSLLVFVAETAMKYSGKTENRAQIASRAYPGRLRSLLITLVTDLHLDEREDGDEHEDHVRDRRGIAEVGVLLERHLVEVVRHRHGLVGGAALGQRP
ncbi:hypothetical protein D9M71_735850 [compost metagenome]